MRRGCRCCCEGYADFMMVHHWRGCAGNRDMLEKLARLPKRIVMSEAPGREGVQSGRRGRGRSSCNEEADIGVRGGPGAVGSRYWRSGEEGGLVVKRRLSAKRAQELSWGSE